MPTETTASVLVGARRPFFAGHVFLAEHSLILREGFRATWTARALATRQRHGTLELSPPTANQIWIGGLLLALRTQAPDALACSEFGECLRADRHRRLTFDPLQSQQIEDLTRLAGEHIDMAITVFDGNFLGPAERLAADQGWMFALAARPTKPATDTDEAWHGPGSLVVDGSPRPNNRPRNVISLEARR